MTSQIYRNDRLLGYKMFVRDTEAILSGSDNNVT